MTRINDGSFDAAYLKGIKDEVLPRMDSTLNGGNGDGVADVEEAYRDLNPEMVFRGIEKNSAAYKKLRGYVDKIEGALEEYAGKDGKFTAEEWAQFLNGEEWGNVLDVYRTHSSEYPPNKGLKAELSQLEDGPLTKGELKVSIFTALHKKGSNPNTENIEYLIDEFAGEDGTFSEEEYEKLNNCAAYKRFLKRYRI